MDKYKFASLNLNNEEKELISKINKILLKKVKKYKNKRIKFKNLIFKGLRIDFGQRVNSTELNENLLKLSKHLAKKLNLKNPKLSIYNDFHSIFAVTWHQDNSIYSSDHPKHEEFFNENKDILKFYIKSNFSFLDLMVKDKNNNLFFLKSNNEKIGFFDVRNYHQTYISVPFNLSTQFLYRFTKLLNRILVKLSTIFRGFNIAYSSNFYFIIFEDCPIFREYEINEIKRAKRILIQ